MAAHLDSHDERTGSYLFVFTREKSERVHAGTLLLVRCAANAPHSTRRCGRLVVAAVQGRAGRHAVYCCPACRVRAHRAALAAVQRNATQQQSDTHTSAAAQLDGAAQLVEHERCS